jgi:hypothetical protein
VFHTVSGPHNGYFVSAYACPLGELGQNFVGNFKVFAHEPKCFCDPGHCHAGSCTAEFDQPALALKDALVAALEIVAALDPCSTWGDVLWPIAEDLRPPCGDCQLIPSRDLR